jgi:hypothetical protein
VEEIDEIVAKKKGRKTVNSFNKWLDTFLSEKGIALEEVLEVEAHDGNPNFIPVGCLVEAIKQAIPKEQKGIKSMLVKIDFRNGNVRHFLTHLAKAIALPEGIERAS